MGYIVLCDKGSGCVCLCICMSVIYILLVHLLASSCSRVQAHTAWFWRLNFHCCVTRLGSCLTTTHLGQSMTDTKYLLNAGWTGAHTETGHLFPPWSEIKPLISQLWTERADFCTKEFRVRQILGSTRQPTIDNWHAFTAWWIGSWMKRECPSDSILPRNWAQKVLVVRQAS